MQTVLLVVHLMIAVALIGSILLQRSEGGALGIGGGGGGGFMTGRGAANSMTRLTAMLAAGFFLTCIALTVFARFDHQDKSILDTIGKSTATAPVTAPATGATAPASGASQPATGTAPATDPAAAKQALPSLEPILPTDPGTTPKP